MLGSPYATPVQTEGLGVIQIPKVTGPALLAATGMALALSGCAAMDPMHIVIPASMHGKVVLCSSGAEVGPAAVTVTDTDRDHPSVQTVAKDTSPEGVCAAMNKAALDAGFKTVFDDPNKASVQILSRDPDRIKISFTNVRIDVQEF